MNLVVAREEAEAARRGEAVCAPAPLPEFD